MCRMFFGHLILTNQEFIQEQSQKVIGTLRNSTSSEQEMINSIQAGPLR